MSNVQTQFSVSSSPSTSMVILLYRAININKLGIYFYEFKLRRYRKIKTEGCRNGWPCEHENLC